MPRFGMLSSVSTEMSILFSGNVEAFVVVGSQEGKLFTVMWCRYSRIFVYPYFLDQFR